MAKKSKPGRARLLRSQFWFNNPDGSEREPRCTSSATSISATPGRNLLRAPDHRHRADRLRSLALQSPITSSLLQRVREGIRDAGGVAFEFPMHPIQETGNGPTAALDRNLAYLSLVEVLYGYPLDGVVLTTGCDKTTPAAIMAAATVNIPAIVLSGGPMLNGWWRGERAGSGTIKWAANKRLAAAEINY